ncbi:MAG: hypothetical protein LUE21_10870 [Oscillospiraceae bacterium]|nr:hypothetical protein [Oscillospiraceae bacterium]
MRKRLISLVLVLVMVLSLGGVSSAFAVDGADGETAETTEDAETTSQDETGGESGDTTGDSSATEGDDDAEDEDATDDEDGSAAVAQQLTEADTSVYDSYVAQLADLEAQATAAIEAGDTDTALAILESLYTLWDKMEAAAESGTLSEDEYDELYSIADALSAYISTPTVVDDSDKTLTVNASATEVEGDTYTTIQAAINYINTQEDITGWTITVKAGSYARFTVLNGMDNLTVQAAAGETVTIFTMDGSENPDKVSGASPETDGILIRNAQNVTLDGLTITMGTTKTSWVAAGVSNYTEQSKKGDNLTVKNCTFQGSGTGYAVFINTGTTAFTVTGCTFNNVYDGVEMFGDGTLMLGASVTYNTFTNLCLCHARLLWRHGGCRDFDLCLQHCNRHQRFAL